MTRKILLAVVPLGLLVPFLWGGRSGVKGTITASNHAAVEKSVGHHLYAPTYLPRGMEPGENGVRQGAIRVLCDYRGRDDMLIVAQEKRTPDRDAYNQRQFVGRTVEVNGNEGHLTTGSLGERRLTFYTTEVTVILSSSSLSDEELITVARSMQ